MIKQLTQLCGVECIFGGKQKIIRHSQKLLHSFLVLLLILCSQFILLDYYIKSSNFNSQAKTLLRNFCIVSTLHTGTLSKRDQALTLKPDSYFLQVIFKQILIQFSIYTIASRKQVAKKTNVCFVQLTSLSTSLMISFQQQKSVPFLFSIKHIAQIFINQKK